MISNTDTMVSTTTPEESNKSFVVNKAPPPLSFLGAMSAFNQQPAATSVAPAASQQQPRGVLQRSSFSGSFPTTNQPSGLVVSAATDKVTEVNRFSLSPKAFFTLFLTAVGGNRREVQVLY